MARNVLDSFFFEGVNVGNGRKLFLFVFSLFMLKFQPAHSATNSVPARKGAEILLFTPWTFLHDSVAQYFDNKTINDQRAFATQDWQLGEWTPHLTNLQSTLTAKSQLTGFTPHDLNLKSRQVSFKLSVEKITVDQVIERQVGGVIVDVHVKAECGPITMTQNSAQVDAKLSYQILPDGIQTHADLMKLAWGKGTWKVSAIKCQGPGGFDTAVRDELTAQLKDPDRIRPWLEGVLSAKLQAEADTLLTQFVKPIPVSVDKGLVPLMLVFHSLQNSASGVLASGSLLWSQNPGETDVFPLLNRAIPNDAASGKTPVVLTSTQGWSGLIETERRAKGPAFSVNMLKIKDFRDLLQSPTEESVAWPDLANYAYNSPFTMLIDNPSRYDLTWQADGTAALQSPADGVIQSVRAGRKWSYIHFTGTIGGQLKVGVSGGQLDAKVTVRRSSFDATFDPAYVRAFNANTHLDPRVMQGFQNYVKQGFDYSSALPAMRFGTLGTGVFNGWEGVSRDIVEIPVLVHQN
jgi:hypothetical protein